MKVTFLKTSPPISVKSFSTSAAAQNNGRKEPSCLFSHLSLDVLVAVVVAKKQMCFVLLKKRKCENIG